MTPFDALGYVLAAYVAYAGLTGRVFAKSGLAMTLVQRAERPAYFWIVVTIYAGLAVALVIVF